MNKYQHTPEEVIDLHGHTVRKAESVLRELLSRGASLHARIIVGKGNHSTEGPILRTFVKNFLHERNIHFTQSKLKDGGEGALEVYF